MGFFPTLVPIIINSLFNNHHIHIIAMCNIPTSNINYVVFAWRDICKHACFLFCYQYFWMGCYFLWNWVLKGNFKYWARSIKTVQKSMSELGSFIPMTDYFGTDIIGEYWISKYVISITFNINLDFLYALHRQIPNKNSNIINPFICFSKILNKLLLPCSS